MPTEEAVSQPGNSKSGVLSSVMASVGALNLTGEPGRQEKAWQLWRARFEPAVGRMPVSDADKLDLLLLVGGEELQKTVETLAEQPTDYKSHFDKLDLHFKAHSNNTLKVYNFFNIEWLPGMYFSDFETTYS